MDFKVNADGTLRKDAFGVYKTVDKLEQFEQTLDLRLKSFLVESVIGEHNPEIIKSRIKLEVQRIVQNDDKIDGVKTIRVTQSNATPNEYDLFIEYYSGWVTELTTSV